MWFKIYICDLQLHLKILRYHKSHAHNYDDWCDVEVKVTRGENIVFYDEGELLMCDEVDWLNDELRAVLNNEKTSDEGFMSLETVIKLRPFPGENQQGYAFLDLSYGGGNTLSLRLDYAAVKALYYYLLYVTRAIDGASVSEYIVGGSYFSISKQDDKECKGYCSRDDEDDEADEDDDIDDYIRQKREDEYIYLSCCYNLGDCSPTYYYRTDDDSIQEEDIVLVPVGKNNKGLKAWVVEKHYFTKENLPLSLERTKEIIGLAECEVKEREPAHFNRLETPLGAIRFSVNDSEIEYAYTKINCNDLCPGVDEIYSIQIPVYEFSPQSIVKVAVVGKILKYYPETGENLYMIQFNKGDMVMGIGVYDEYEKLNLKNPPYEINGNAVNGFSVVINEPKEVESISFNIAWMRTTKRKNEEQIYFAADPSITQ